MRFFFGSKQIGGVTLIDDHGHRVTLRPGLNDLNEEEREVVESTAQGQEYMSDGVFVARDPDPSEPEPQPEPEPEPVVYVPLTPTVEQLTPLPTIGTVTATSIVTNTPTGGYTSPQQLIDINSLSVDLELVAALFEVA